MQAPDRKLWVGTEFGAASYDGYDFTNYQYSTHNEPIGRILSIAYDNANGIWLGGDKGLFYLQHNRVVKIATTGAPALAVEVLHTDPLGNLWIGDMHGLYKLPAKTIAKLNLSKIIQLSLRPYAGFASRVFDVDTDEAQNIYIASFDGVFKCSPNKASVLTLWKNPLPQENVRSLYRWQVV
ncbi:MAG: hypothetical protein EOO03_10630 [Chitinophagaceae bacterium]|nr:MAG: hypothetical protein EOO03_10630 [Chitinophagaceae bacterium]